MPLIVNRREYGIPIRLKSGRQIVLLSNQTAEISDEDLSSFGVRSALDAQHIVVRSSGSSQKTSVKTEKVKTEKVKTEKAETEKAETEKVEVEKAEAEDGSSAEKSKKGKEGKAS